jgi:hypothetical protein
VQLGSPFTQLAKSLIFDRSASVQLLLLNAWTQESLLNGIAGSWPQPAYFPLSPLSALATLSHVDDGELPPEPHPTAKSSSAAHTSTIDRIQILPFSLVADAPEKTTLRATNQRWSLMPSKDAIRFHGRRSFRVGAHRREATAGWPAAPRSSRS